MQTDYLLNLPLMGCGTWAWGNQLLWGYNQSMDNQLQEVFNLCVSSGVTLFDTGDSYG
ncbi:aldo/keto reductase, partial [Dolichospermum circinale CS-545/17]|nr:aldo/keto reductase [Dolichospermum circinale CS-545/17]